MLLRGGKRGEKMGGFKLRFFMTKGLSNIFCNFFHSETLKISRFCHFSIEFPNITATHIELQMFTAFQQAR